MAYRPPKYPHGDPPPSWLNIRKDQQALQSKLDRIAKIIANANGAMVEEAIEDIRAICEESLDDDGQYRDEAGSG